MTATTRPEGALRLHSGAPWFLLRHGLEDPPSVAPTGPVDVTVVGAGVTGALIADALAAEGMRVVVLDRRPPATGSTAACTALLQYELDRPLVELVREVGEDDAVRAYRMSAEAIDALGDVVAGLGEPCGYARSPSVQLASRPRHARALEREAELRRTHGLDAALLSRDELQSRYGLPGHGALHTTHAAVVDPVALTRALLARATARGAIVLPGTTVHDLARTGAGLALDTSRGALAAGQVVFAPGYELPPRLMPERVRLHSTFALVTEPAEDLGAWGGRCLVWETARPYLYLRATDEGRVICGGEDVPFRHPDARDALLPVKVRRLERRLSALLPDAPLETAFAWSGTFAETRDGLPYIGACPELDGALVALGYGGNGVTFSVVAAGLVRDIVLGRADPADLHPFRLDR